MPSPDMGTLVENSRRISDAWAWGHEEAARLRGDDGPGCFTGPRGNALIFALEAMPLDSTLDAMKAVVSEHLAVEPW